MYKVLRKLGKFGKYNRCYSIDRQFYCNNKTLDISNKGLFDFLIASLKQQFGIILYLLVQN